MEKTITYSEKEKVTYEAVRSTGGGGSGIESVFSGLSLKGKKAASALGD